MTIVSNRFGQAVPDVFIASVRISKGYDSIKERENTRYSRAARDGKLSDRYSNESTARISGDDGGQLIATVNLYIKEIVNSTNQKYWFSNSKINKRLKIRIVQSLSSAATKEISRNPLQILPGGHYDNISKTAADGASTSVICRDIDFNKPSNFKVEDCLTTKMVDHNVYDVPYQTIFSLPNDNPPHLTYFAVCYFDSNIESNIRNKRPRPPLLSSLGRIATEQVIKNRKTVKNSNFYITEKDGRPYFGPIYQKETGETFTGVTSNAGPNNRLSTSAVPNVKIIDYRVFDKFKKVSISFKENDKDIIKASDPIRGKVSYNKKNDDVFFTDLYLNRKRDGTTNLIFGVKMEKIFKNYSHYAKIFNNPDDSIVAPILGASRIRKLRIVRRRIDENKTTFDKLRGKKMLPFINPDGSYDEHVVVEMFNRPLLTMAAASTMKSRRFDKYTREEVGKIDKVNLSIGAVDDIIYLQVSDNQIAKVTEGNYQYGIELEIEDNTQMYLISKLAAFESAIKGYQDFSNIARIAGYNKNNKKYSEAFMSLSTVLNFSTGDDTSWTALLKRFVETINIFMGHDKNLTEELQTSLIRTLYSLSSPVTNNPKDMNYVITMMIEFASKIRNKLTNDAASTNRRKITSGLYTKSEAKPRTYLFKLEKYFGTSYKGYSNNNISSEIVDASLDPNYGYEYFEYDDTSESGLQTYSASDIIKRSQIETLRYYNSEDPTVDLKVDDKIYTNRDFVALNKYRYFAPSYVSLGRSKKVNLIEEEDNIFNKNKNVALLLDIMGYRMSQVENNMTDYSRHSYSQKLDSYLAFRDVNRIVNNNESDLEGTKYNLVDDYFGKSTKIVIDRNVTDDQEIINMINRESDDRYSSKSKNIKKLSETNIAGNGIMLSLLGAHYLKTLEPIKDLEKWNLRNPENIVAFLDNVKSGATLTSERADTDTTLKLQKRGPNQVPLEKQKIIKEMPLQLKSLLHQGVNNIVKNNFRKELFNSSFNPLQDASKFIMFWLLHGQIIELQAYVGNPLMNNDENLKEPSWQPVTSDIWNNIVNRGMTLCRVVRYKNPMLLGTYPESLDLPIYNEYFLIKGDSSAPAKNSKIKTRIAKKVEKIINSSDKIYNEGIPTEYIFNSQIRSGRTNVMRKDRPRPPSTRPNTRGNKVGSAQSDTQPRPGRLSTTMTPRGGNTGGGGY